MAIDWMSQAVIAKTALVFTNFSHWAIGAYCLEWALSLKFEYQLITGKRKFKIPQLLYFYCKWAVLAAFVGMLVAFNVSSPVNCQVLYTSNQYFGNTGIASSSTLLMLRTFAIWNQNKFVVFPLVALSLAQWGIAFYSVTTVKASFVAAAGTCVVGEVKDLDLNLLYLSTMFVDCVVLILTLIGLLTTPGRSSLWKLLMADGILFFAVAFTANTLPAVLLLIDLNPVMNIMFSIPAVGISAAVASRSFVRLTDYANPMDVGKSSQVWTHTSRSITRPATSTKVGTVSIGHWNRPNKEDEDYGGINITQHQHVDVELGTFQGRSMHPLADHPSNEYLESKGRAF